MLYKKTFRSILTRGHFGKFNRFLYIYLAYVLHHEYTWHF